MPNNAFLGIDTSNYTTSTALAFEDGTVVQSKRVLEVPEGQRGLRQSEAVFAHIKNLPDVLSVLFEGRDVNILGVGWSKSPRDVEGSYMPCFLAGHAPAAAAALSIKAPLYSFSHQAGHIMAAVYSSGRTELTAAPFIAFHLSGGTTEALLVKPGTRDVPFDIEIISHTSDISAGQAIDRCGVALGLSFPCGGQLEALALRSEREFKIKSSFRDGKCSLSGVENKFKSMLEAGEDGRDIARFVFEQVKQSVYDMTDYALSMYPGLPVLYAGGVMSSVILKDCLGKRYKSFFASPEFSSDNAAGTALLAMRSYNEANK
ncbi:MAG: peptidase M22 [Eubacteriales bacterium]